MRDRHVQRVRSVIDHIAQVSVMHLHGEIMQNEGSTTYGKVSLPDHGERRVRSRDYSAGNVVGTGGANADFQH